MLIIFTWLATALAIFGLTVLVGFLTIHCIVKIDHVTALFLSNGVGCAVLAGLEFIVFVFFSGSPVVYALVLFVYIAVLLFSLALQKKKLLFSFNELKPFLPIFVFYWVMVLYTLTVSVYQGSYMYGDWYIHYRTSLFFAGNCPTGNCAGFLARTPLYNLFAGFFLGFISPIFGIYQLASITASISVIGPLILLAKRVRGNITLLMIFLGLNSFFYTMMLYPWPKLLAAAFVLAALWRLAEPLGFRNYVMIGLFLGLAFLTHPSTLIYTAAFGLILLWRIRNQPVGKVILTVAGTAACFVLVITPWLSWVGIHYSLKDLILMSPAYDTEVQRFSLVWVRNRLATAVMTWIPGYLLLYPRSHVLQFPEIPSLLNLWFRFYDAIIPGCLTLSLSSLLLYQNMRSLFNNMISNFRAFGRFIFWFGFWGGVVLMPMPHPLGVVQESMSPIILLTLLLAVLGFDLVTITWQKRLLMGIGLEFIFSWVIFSILLAFNFPGFRDQNFLLKTQMNPVFLRDLIGDGWTILWSLAFALQFCLLYGLIKSYFKGKKMPIVVQTESS